jgi:L-ascorbate metabolism protein UlaG (beta-lactamase superfamily)
LINNRVVCSNDSISVTYIANCGFLVEMDNQKIIIDGLFKLGHNRYPTSDTNTQRLLVSNRYPFNDIALILVSHTHEDHFDKEMVTACMLNNPSARLICPQQVIDSLSENEDTYYNIKTRIIGCTLRRDTSQLIHFGSIEIYACKLPHVGGGRFKDTQNIAFLICGKGKSVFHSADIDPFHIHEYSGIKISELNVDIGFLNEDFAKIENAGPVREFINAKHNIAMHLPDYMAAGWMDSLKNKPDLFRDPFIFSRKMEKKVFYTSQEK